MGHLLFKLNRIRLTAGHTPEGVFGECEWPSTGCWQQMAVLERHLADLQEAERVQGKRAALQKIDILPVLRAGFYG